MAACLQQTGRETSLLKSLIMRMASSGTTGTSAIKKRVVKRRNKKFLFLVSFFGIVGPLTNILVRLFV